MKAQLTKRYRFSASHRLHNDDFSAERNQETYGKCNNPHGHGHNYTLSVTVVGEVDPATGMVCNLADLDAVVQSEVLERYSDSNLNTLEEFRSQVPTTENLCVAIFERLKRNLRAAQVEKIQMEETLMNSFEYAGGKEIRP